MWDFSAVVYPEHESMTTDLFGPVAIDTNIRLAAMRQLHCAIERLKEGHYEAAITLAAGAEGMLPETAARHLRPAVKKMSKQPNIQQAGGSTDPNAIINWLKHANIDDQRVVPPEILETIRRQRRVDGRAGDRPMAEPACPGVAARAKPAIVMTPVQHQAIQEVFLGRPDALQADRP
jgi:hypothetical protein